MMYKHMVIYVGRSSVFTDRRFTEKLHNALHTHEAHGWELVSTAARASPLGDVSGIWLFFKRSPAYQPEHGQDHEQDQDQAPPAGPSTLAGEEAA